MNLQRMEYFLAVAKHLSFSKAAEELYISHQALSKQIQMLEAELDAKLLERDTVRVVLTEIGRKTVELYGPIFYNLNRSEADLLDFIQHKKTCIRIGYFNGLPYRKAVAPVIEYISKQLPDIEPTITALDISDTHRLLEEDELDLLVSVRHSEYTWVGIKYIPIITLPQKIIVSEYHPWYKKDVITAEDMAQNNLICYENSFGPSKQSFMEQVEVSERIYVRNVSTYSGILAQGKAFGILSELHNQSESTCKLFDLPPEYASNVQLVAVCKPLHPRVDVFEQLGRIYLDV